jgi:hypothetical protein
MIKVSHESPLCLLERSIQYNSFDYALVHLLDKSPTYYNFFKQSLLQNREVLLDNSIFELGTAFDSREYAKWVMKLLPTYYIVPDVLEDSEATMHSFMDFNETYTDLPGLKIGAVQGKTYQEIEDCYKFMVDCADYVAISFDFSFYQFTGKGSSKHEKMMSGRQRLIQQLIDDGTWCWEKPVHLLGCSLPQEFKYYVQNDIYNIRSLDTSNPVMAGIKGLKYSGDLGLKTKPAGLLADNLEIDLNDDQKHLIEYNIAAFKSIINR